MVVDSAPERPAEGELLPVALLEPAVRGDLDPDRAPVDAAARAREPQVERPELRIEDLEDGAVGGKAEASARSAFDWWQTGKPQRIATAYLVERGRCRLPSEGFRLLRRQEGGTWAARRRL